MPEVVRLRSGVEWQDIDGEVVALDLETSAYLAVNDTGALLWPLVVAGTTEAGLVEVLIDRYQIDEAQARADVGAFVAHLRSFSLLDPAP